MTAAKAGRVDRVQALLRQERRREAAAERRAAAEAARLAQKNRVKVKPARPGSRYIASDVKEASSPTAAASPGGDDGAAGAAGDASSTDGDAKAEEKPVLPRRVADARDKV